MDRENGSPLKTVLTWIVAVVVAIVALRILFWALEAAWALGAFLLFTVVPIALVGWLAVKLIGYLRREEV